MRMRVLLVAALGLMFAASAAFAADSVTVMKDMNGASYLADSKGMALYTFKNDKPGTSTCTGGCAANWPAFYAGKAMLPKGLDAKDFGSIKREDGKMQTTFRGMPLYYFVGDKKKGQLDGRGVMDLWFTADPTKGEKAW